MNPILDAIYSRFRRHPRQFFKLSDEFRPAIRVSAVIQRVHPDENIMRAYYLSPGQSVAEEDCVSRRDVGNGNSVCHFVCAAIFRNFGRVGQGRTAKPAQIDLDHSMLADAQRFGDLFGRVDLNLVTLSVAKGKREDFIAFLFRDRQRRRRVDTAAQQNNCWFHLLPVGRRAAEPSLFAGTTESPPTERSGKLARTVSAIPPRAEKEAVMFASRGWQARTRSSRMRLATASLNPRSLRNEAR